MRWADGLTKKGYKLASGYTGTRFRALDITLKSKMKVILAGWVAEFNFHGRGELHSDYPSNLEYVLSELQFLCDEERTTAVAAGGDTYGALADLMESYPEAKDVRAILT
jgi:hypothetical protein